MEIGDCIVNDMIVCRRRKSRDESMLVRLLARAAVSLLLLCVHCWDFNVDCKRFGIVFFFILMSSQSACFQILPFTITLMPAVVSSVSSVCRP
jgi:hypothetical protein